MVDRIREGLRKMYKEWSIDKLIENSNAHTQEMKRHLEEYLNEKEQRDDIDEEIKKRLQSGGDMR